MGASLAVSAQGIEKLNGNALFGDIEARHIGPALMSGRVSDVVGHPYRFKNNFYRYCRRWCVEIF